MKVKCRCFQYIFVFLYFFNVFLIKVVGGIWKSINCEQTSLSLISRFVFQWFLFQWFHFVLRLNHVTETIHLTFSTSTHSVSKLLVIYVSKSILESACTINVKWWMLLISSLFWVTIFIRIKIIIWWLKVYLSIKENFWFKNAINVTGNIAKVKQKMYVSALLIGRNMKFNTNIQIISNNNNNNNDNNNDNINDNKIFI